MSAGFRGVEDVVVVSYKWQRSGYMAVTLSWAPAKRRTFLVPADQFNETTVRHLREQTAREVQEGRIT